MSKDVKELLEDILFLVENNGSLVLETLPNENGKALLPYFAKFTYAQGLEFDFFMFKNNLLFYFAKPDTHYEN